MPEYSPAPFNYKGVVQKKDPAQLAPGEYYQAENVTSIQEGSLTARTGHQSLTSVALTSPIVSLSKMNIGGADSANPRYLGSAANIYRDLPPYSSNSNVYSGLTSGARWSAEQYNSGTSGSPSLYFATRDAALRDSALNGALSYSTTLQKWGIDPPPVPVQATPVLPNGVYITTGSTARFVPSQNSDGSGNKTCSSFGSGTGYVQITPTAAAPFHGVNGIYVGMILQITDTNTALNEKILVLATDSVSFYAVTANAHVAANVTLSWVQQDLTTIFGTFTEYFNSLTVNAAFNGTPENGYSTDDNFHIALSSTDVINVTKIEIRIVPNYSGSGGAATDYYSYSIVPASLMSAGSATSPAWLELNIPKNAFTPVGNAGSGAFTWLNINEIDVIATANATGAGATVGISSMYFVGGGGLNSTAKGTTLYTYRYVYRNPTTQAVGNPCPEMIAPLIPPGVTNGRMTLTLTGTAQAATQANGIFDISGQGSIKIYRSGGSFTDGLYRHIGYVINPGSGAAVTFTDNASDASLAIADTLEFDNDPPVPSSLPVPLTASILKFQPSGGGTDYDTSAQANSGSATAVTMPIPLVAIRIVLSSLPTNFTASTIASTIGVGSTIQVGFGDTFESCIISAIGYATASHATSAWVEAFLQYNHQTTANNASETVECDATIRGKCDLIAEAFSCLFVAGDANNPSTLYQSKVSQPESFPVVNLENNFSQQINVGSPSNPIFGVTSIGPGEIVCLNQDTIFIVQVWAGQMQQPLPAPATRGLFSKWCWTKGDNRIWYLGYDGIYTWAGGQSQKISNAIDYLFKKQTVNGIPPINMSLAAQFSFSYAENSLYVGYIDTNNLYHRLRYEAIYDRWTIETVIDSVGGVYAFTALFTEPDTGNFLVAITNTSSQSYLWLADFYSTTDGWVTVPTDGIQVKYNAWRFWQIQDPTADYQIGEIVLELLNPTNAVTTNLYYNYSTSATNTIAIAANALPARGRFFSTVNSSTTSVQYSIGLQLTGTTGNGVLTQFYTFGFRDYPWSDGGYPGPKTFQWLTIQANTNGIDVPMQLQLDGTSDAIDFTINGTFFDRNNTITLNPNPLGTQFRVVPKAGTSTTGTSGAVQIYGIQPQFQKQPIPLTHWQSQYQVLGAAGWKVIWQVWIDFQSAVDVVLSIYRDDGLLFFQKTVPAQPIRDVARFYVPPVNKPTGAADYQFNKSQGYQFMLDAVDGATSFQLWRDGSRVDGYYLDSDQRAGFNLVIIWEQMPTQP